MVPQRRWGFDPECTETRQEAVKRANKIDRTAHWTAHFDAVRIGGENVEVPIGSEQVHLSGVTESNTRNGKNRRHGRNKIFIIDDAAMEEAFESSPKSFIANPG